jgi:hypothetical protein
MSVAAHRTNEQTQHDRPAIPLQRRRTATAAPPSRRRVTAVPRVMPRAACAPRRPHLPVTWLLAVAGVACAAVVGLGVLSGSGAGSVPDRTTVVRVEPGENLWELADRVAPGSDAQAVVDRIRDLNGGLAGGVTPGQPLTVPTE